MKWNHAQKKTARSAHINFSFFFVERFISLFVICCVSIQPSRIIAQIILIDEIQKVN